ncbi:MAG: ATP-binding protein [Nitratireductor sp.]
MTALANLSIQASDGERTDERIPTRERLRYRISLAFGLIMIIAFAISSGILSVRGYLSDISASSERLRGIASVLASTVASDFVAGNQNGALQSLTAIRDLPEIEFVAIEDMSGARFADIGTATFLTTQRNDISDVSSIELLFSNTIWVKAQIRKGGERIGWIYLLSDISRIRSAALQGLAINALIALVATLISLVAASRAVATMIRPLSQLSGLMRSLSRNAHYSVRADENAQGEIGVLAQSFNTMLSRIDSRDQQLRDYRFNLEQKVETRTQQLRAAKDEAEAANSAKSDFLATMSHEIRTPMNGMMVMAQLLVKAPLAEQYRRYANVISRSGQGLLTIINDILDISKIEAGKLELEKVDVVPDEIVSGVISLFWERAQEKDLELGFHIAADVPQVVQADQTRLTQVVTNLVNNALKFTEHGGVSVRMSVVESQQPDHCRLRCSVMDTGIGIAEEKLKSVFERFTQADQSTTRKFGGTGLGLSISQRLIEAMGGEIGVTSRLRKGSTFWFEVDLPVVKSARQPTPALLQRRKIAIVTRGPIEGACLEAAFTEQGFDVHAGLKGLPEVSTVHAVLCDPALVNTLPHGYDRVPAVAIAGIGNQLVANLLASGQIKDVLNLPFERSELREMSERLRVREFRGVNAISETATTGAEMPDFTGLKILAVDDNMVNREVLRDALQTFKIDVTLAESGEEALDLVSLKDFDLIFMDCSMPGMDGFETTRHIREIENHMGRSPVPVVALTAHVSGEESQKWRKSGMNGYLTKPFTIETIVNTIREQTRFADAQDNLANGEEQQLQGIGQQDNEQQDNGLQVSPFQPVSEPEAEYFQEPVVPDSDPGLETTETWHQPQFQVSPEQDSLYSDGIQEVAIETAFQEMSGDDHDSHPQIQVDLSDTSTGYEAETENAPAAPVEFAGYPDEPMLPFDDMKSGQQYQADAGWSGHPGDSQWHDESAYGSAEPGESEDDTDLYGKYLAVGEQHEGQHETDTVDPLDQFDLRADYREDAVRDGGGQPDFPVHGNPESVQGLTEPEGTQAPNCADAGLVPASDHADGISSTNANIDDRDIVRQSWRDNELISPETLSLLETLSHGGNPDMACKIFGMFIQHAEPAITDLRSLLTTQAQSSAAKPTHAVKSMALSAGAPVVAGILQRMEDYCKAGEGSRAAMLLDELDHAFSETCKAMTAYIDGRPNGAAASA